MTAAVFDAAAIAERRRHLFGAPEPQSAKCIDRERSGSAENHCAICPKAPDENCTLSCTNEANRQAAEDGVTVT